ncbi:helix-turn-helix domain-containing protein [Virgibacillus oceani]
MESNKLSMRKLSKRTGIDTATISKIVNGKRKANLNHLYKFAESLHVSVTSLLEATGYEIKTKIPGAEQGPVDLIREFLKSSPEYDETLTMKLIEKRKAEYENYSLTHEGKQTIFNNFKNKLNNIGGKGSFIQHLEMMFERFRQKKGTKKELTLMGSALLYFIFTMDAVPDYLFPVGYLDDALVVQMVLQSLSAEKI